MDMMSLRRRVMVNQNKLMTATGNPITFNTPLTKPLKECVVRFTPQQEGSGTPSPDNVRNISGRSSITVYQQGGDGVTHETSVSFPATVGDNGVVYGGYVDLVNGEVVAEWTKVDMGDLKWGIAWNTFNTAPSDHANNDANGTPAEIMCDIYPSDINTSATVVGVINKNIRGRVKYKHICIRDDDYATAADFKTAVTGHYLAYKLAEPIHYPISPRILTTLRGDNVMWSDTNGDITIKYWSR